MGEKGVDGQSAEGRARTWHSLPIACQSTNLSASLSVGRSVSWCRQSDNPSDKVPPSGDQQQQSERDGLRRGMASALPSLRAKMPPPGQMALHGTLDTRRYMACRPCSVPHPVSQLGALGCSWMLLA